MIIFTKLNAGRCGSLRSNFDNLRGFTMSTGNGTGVLEIADWDLKNPSRSAVGERSEVGTDPFKMDVEAIWGRRKDEDESAGGEGDEPGEGGDEEESEGDEFEDEEIDDDEFEEEFDDEFEDEEFEEEEFEDEEFEEDEEFDDEEEDEDEEEEDEDY